MTSKESESQLRVIGLKQENDLNVAMHGVISPTAAIEDNLLIILGIDPKCGLDMSVLISALQTEMQLPMTKGKEVMNALQRGRTEVLSGNPEVRKKYQHMLSSKHETEGLSVEDCLSEKGIALTKAIFDTDTVSQAVSDICELFTKREITLIMMQAIMQFRLHNVKQAAEDDPISMLTKLFAGRHNK